MVLMSREPVPQFPRGCSRQSTSLLLGPLLKFIASHVFLECPGLAAWAGSLGHTGIDHGTPTLTSHPGRTPQTKGSSLVWLNTHCDRELTASASFRGGNAFAGMSPK